MPHIAKRIAVRTSNDPEVAIIENTFNELKLVEFSLFNESKHPGTACRNASRITTDRCCTSLGSDSATGLHKTSTRHASWGARCSGWPWMNCQKRLCWMCCMYYDMWWTCLIINLQLRQTAVSQISVSCQGICRAADRSNARTWVSWSSKWTPYPWTAAKKQSWRYHTIE